MKIKDKKIKVGLVGLGRSGWGIHGKALQRSSEYSIIAVCDPDQDRLKEAKKRFACRVWADFNDFLSQPMDIVVIASPSKLHFSMARSAINAGKHVVLEKPLSNTAKEAGKLLVLAEKTGRIVSPFYNFRFKPDFLLIQELLKKELIGRPFLIKRGVGYFNRRDDWQAQKKEMGGILNAATIHHFDQVLQLAGSLPVGFWSDLQQVAVKGDVADHSKIILRFSSGCVADIEVSWAQALPAREWVVYGSSGVIYRSGNQLSVKWFKGSDIKKIEPRGRSYFAKERINWRHKSFKLADNSENIYYAILAKALKGRGPLPVNMESAIASMRLLEKLQ